MNEFHNFSLPILTEMRLQRYLSKSNEKYCFIIIIILMKKKKRNSKFIFWNSMAPNLSAMALIIFSFFFPFSTSVPFILLHGIWW